MRRFTVQQKKVEDKVFHYFDLSDGRGYKRVWVSSRLLAKDPETGKLYIEFPVKDAGIFISEKGTIRLKPKPGSNLFYYEVGCGYRGSASVKPKNEEDVVNSVYHYYYHSPRGNLGVDEGAIFETPKDKLHLVWHRSGRLYGSPADGECLLHLDGREECLDAPVEDLEDLN